jgi:hypothetical protein
MASMKEKAFRERLYAHPVLYGGLCMRVLLMMNLATVGMVETDNQCTVNCMLLGQERS